jgi:site-specific DNA recombinase
MPKEIYERLAGGLKQGLKQIHKQLEQISDFESSNLESAIKKALSLSVNLSAEWVSATMERKEILQKMLFPEGIIFDKEKQSFRTPKVNQVFSVINSLSIENRENKKGLTDIEICQSLLVASVGIEPASKV